MKLTVKDLLENSFVISIDEINIAAFYRRFKDAGLLPLPKHFVGHTLKNGDYSYVKFSQRNGITNCTRSHHDIIVMAKALDLPFVCIFEDDAIPAEGAVDTLESVLSDIPDYTRVLFLGSLSRSTGYDSPYRPSVLEHCYVNGSHAYVIFKRHYDEYLLRMYRENAVADIVFNKSSDNDSLLASKENIFMQFRQSNSNTSTLHDTVSHIKLNIDTTKFDLYDLELSVDDINESAINF